jgi:formylglycine-generating enzyme required for sulfatase activity
VQFFKKSTSMKPIALFPFLCILPLAAFAQQRPCDSCDCLLVRARALSEEAKDFQAALRYFEAVKICDEKQTEAVNAEILLLFTKINKLKDDALLAQGNAERLAIEAKANLAEAQRANERVPESVLQYADAAILNMDYEKALNETNNAAGLKVKQAEVFPRYFEIAFWHSETGNTQRAISILDTALTMMGKPKLSNTLGKQPDRPQLREAMEKLDKDRYGFLLRRYYPHMVFIEGGTFDMGCDSVSVIQTFGVNYCWGDERQHTVTLGDYYLAETETTWWQFGLYRAANGKNVWKNWASWLPTGDHPVVNVDWYDALEYANWVSLQFNPDSTYVIDKEQKDPNNISDYDDKQWLITDMQKPKSYRLPTEAEWEYAASTGRKSVFAGTSLRDSLHFYGNYSDNSGEKDGFQYTSPSKKYLPNRRGLYDMSGNVWEWCWDWYDGNYYEDDQQNPRGPDGGSSRVYRGGSWSIDPASLRCAYRNGWNPVFRFLNIGFRLARAAR